MQPYYYCSQYYISDSAVHQLFKFNDNTEYVIIVEPEPDTLLQVSMLTYNSLKNIKWMILKENKTLKKTKILFDIFTNHIKHIVEMNICDNLSRGIKI